MQRLCGVFLTLLGASLYAEPDLAREPAPSWVKTADWRPPASTVTGVDYETYLHDYQVNLVTNEEYIHYAFRYVTRRAVQDDSTFQIDYAPDYQTVRLHTLTLWRDGKAVDQKTIPFRNVQRESDLEQSMYDGDHTWVGFLKNVQPGDVLEAAYTVRGRNPIFGGRYADSYLVEDSYPVAQWSLRVLAPRGRSPELRAFHTSVRPIKTTWNGLEETTAAARDVEGVDSDDEAPTDIDERGRYVLSDWKGWDEVVRWALPLYAQTPSSEVTAQASELVQDQKTDDEKLLALLEFVQDKIRYLGIEVGANSHQPRPAAEVLSNGFGDCKDKVMLFCTLAASAGLKAWPVLVHTSNGVLVNTEGPTPLAFNHVIAAVASSRGVVYVDPTTDQQGGALTDRVLGSFAYGLEVRPGVHALTALPQATAGRRELIQTYHFRAFQDTSEVSMEYTYSGSDADDQRRRWDGMVLADWRKDTSEWLQDHYGEASLSGDPETSDDRKTNIFHVSYKFTVKNYWKKSGKGWEADFYPSLVGANLYDPSYTAARSLPYAIEYPETVRQVRRIEVPEDWNIDKSDETLNGPGFRLHASARQVSPRLVEMVDEYQSLSDRVTPGQWNDYLKALRDARQNIDWTLTWNTDGTDAAPAAKPGHATDNRFLTTVGSVALGVLLFFAAFQGAVF